MRAEFFLAGMVEQEEDGRILLGDNTGSGAVMLPQIGLQYFGIPATLGLPCTVHAHVYSIPSCAKYRLRQTFQNVITANECLYSHSDRTQASNRT